MRRYSEAVKVDVRKRMSPPHRESVARIPEELGIHVFTLYNSSYWNDTRAPEHQGFPTFGIRSLIRVRCQSG